MNKYTSILVIVIFVVLGIWFVSKKSAEEATKPVIDNWEEQNTKTASAAPLDTKPITNNIDTKKVMSATLKTNMGDISFQFYNKDAPNTVANFVKLAKAGFYDKVKFHRVIKGFMIQGGDPLTKDDSKMALWGTGDPGYKFADEINAQSNLYKTGYKKGIVAMANSGPNTNGSQFFIMHADYPLPPLYTIFGFVTAGQDVVDKIANVSVNQNDRPLSPVVINSVTVN